jgi:hypothetical protein
MLELSNTDVTWDATYDGLAPRLSERAAAQLRADEATIAALLALLDDPERFVAAHVALTRVAAFEYSAFPDWNGLRVELGPDGLATVDPGQRPALAARWRAWHAASPRPRALP